MNRYFFITLLFLCLAASLPALGAKEKDSGKTTHDVIQVSGTVRLVGTGLSQEIVISGSENEWYIDREEMSKLNDFQQRKVTVEGEETVVELHFAGGMSAGVRHILKNIKIISIE